MAVKKSDLKAHVQDVWNTKALEIRKERGEAVDAHLVEALKPYEDLIKKYVEADNTRTEAFNAVVEAFDNDGIRNYHFNYMKSKTFEGSWDSVLKRISSDFYTGTIKGTEAVSKPYDDRLKEINTSYNGVYTNVKNLSPKKGFDYLLQLGFDLTGLTGNEASVPMIVVDPESLGLKD